MKPAAIAFLSCVLASSAYGDFSVDLPIVTRTQGTSTTFYTAIDVTNHTAQSATVNFEYLSSDFSVVANGRLTSLGAYANFHTDDFLQYLVSQNLITAGQSNSFGTLLITFVGSSFVNGNEASATVRIYNFVNAGQRPSVGMAYRGAVLRTNGPHALSSVISNTSGSTNASPSVITNVGLENIGIDDAGTLQIAVITVKATFYDPNTGNVVGSQPTFTLGPGQMTQINDIWKSANLPADATSLVMNITETAGTAQIRGYVVVKDTNTNDGSFFFME